jgi:TRAP-type C4-dicarboxylate transport system permease large subunit
VGSALFVGCAVGKTTLEKTAKAALPMFGMMFIVLMLVTYIPAITMWLPGILFGK